MTHVSTISTNPFRKRWHAADGRGRGFTLTELLVVMSIIIAMLALAVPLFNVMTGTRSVEGATNRISAMLQRARARAIGLQDQRGVLFYDDVVTGQVGMLMVRVTPFVPASVDKPYQLELDETNPEPEFLPKGVGIGFYQPKLTNVDVASGTATASDLGARTHGLVMFDGLGRLQQLYASPFASASTNPKPADSDIYKAYFDRTKGGTTYPLSEWSSGTILLYDRNAMGNLEADPNPMLFSDAQRQWLNQNASLLLISRYNGTITKGD